MLIDTFIGKEFEERALYDRLLFDIEANFDQYRGKFLVLYFELKTSGKVAITEILRFECEVEMDQHCRKAIKQHHIINIYELGQHISLTLSHMDGSGQHSSIWRNRTRTESGGLAWFDDDSKRRPMSEAEIRRAFQELAGIFVDETELQKLKPIKSVI